MIVMAYGADIAWAPRHIDNIGPICACDAYFPRHLVNRKDFGSTFCSGILLLVSLGCCMQMHAAALLPGQ